MRMDRVQLTMTFIWLSKSTDHSWLEIPASQRNVLLPLARDLQASYRWHSDELDCSATMNKPYHSSARDFILSY